MAKYDALISGSFALQFFERVTWPDSDLDIFVEQGEGCELFCKYLVEAEGYDLVRSQDQDRYAMYDLMEIRTYTKIIPDACARSLQKETQIQVVTTRDIPIQAILRGFYSTVVVNIITWNKAFAIYPLTTFIQYRGYMLKKLDDYFASFLVKYAARGWRIQETMWPEDQRENHPIQLNRRLGDKYTWVIDLGIKNVQWSRTPDYVLEHCMFETDNAGITLEAQNGFSKYDVSASLFQSHALRYKYTYVMGWMRFLGRRTNNLTALELQKMKPSDRPVHYQILVDLLADGDSVHHYTILDKPASWTFWGSEIPRWFEAWQKLEKETGGEN